MMLVSGAGLMEETGTLPPGQQAGLILDTYYYLLLHIKDIKSLRHVGINL